MATYRDVVKLVERERLLAWRNGSVEINELMASVLGARVCIDGCWGIASVQGCEDESRVKQLLEVAEKIARSSPSCPGLSEAKLFRGSVSVGVEEIDFARVSDLASSLCSEAMEEGVEDCEVVVLHRIVERRIEGPEGVAEERRSWVEVEAGLRMGSGFGSWRGFSIAWSTSGVERLLEEVFRSASTVLRASLKSRPLNPLNVGKALIVLDPEASAALIHEVSHLLTPPMGRELLGKRLGPNELNLVDDPTMMGVPSSRPFDDEGVECRRRVLIEGGTVVDLHHTRETAHAYGSAPGSAHGLFTKPIPFHTTLVLQPGDWRFEEIVEETREGYLVTGVAMATLEGGYVRLVPLASYRIEKGEVREPVRLRSVTIPVRFLRQVDALGRELRARYGYEKQWLVSEIAPAIRLPGYVG